MKIDVLYFGKIASVTELKEEVIELPCICCSVQEFKTFILLRYAALYGSTFRVAVNRDLKEDAYEIRDHDVVAFLPPYAGG